MLMPQTGRARFGGKVNEKNEKRSEELESIQLGRGIGIAGALEYCFPVFSGARHHSVWGKVRTPRSDANISAVAFGWGDVLCADGILEAVAFILCDVRCGDGVDVFGDPSPGDDRDDWFCGSISKRVQDGGIRGRCDRFIEKG
jgi:hypothetical protein